LGAGTAAGACDRGAGAAGECSRTPIAVAGEHRFGAISAGRAHACAIDTAGAVFCWGENQFRQLVAGMAVTLSAAATVLATVTLRNDRRATAARVAMVLGTLTLLAGTVGGVWLYFEVVRS
jgi:alpha-tubulin suppressor-like RCC1 family protein